MYVYKFVILRLEFFMMVGNSFVEYRKSVVIVMEEFDMFMKDSENVIYLIFVDK